MAAYWRWSRDRKEPFVPGLEPNTIQHWIYWIKDEVDNWALYNPIIIQYIYMTINALDEEMAWNFSEKALNAVRNKYACMLDD